MLRSLFEPPDDPPPFFHPRHWPGFDHGSEVDGELWSGGEAWGVKSVQAAVVDQVLDDMGKPVVGIGIAAAFASPVPGVRAAMEGDRGGELLMTAAGGPVRP